MVDVRLTASCCGCCGCCGGASSSSHSPQQPVQASSKQLLRCFMVLARNTLVWSWPTRRAHENLAAFSSVARRICSVAILYALGPISRSRSAASVQSRENNLSLIFSTSRPTGHATHTLTPEPSAQSRALYEGPPAVPTLPKAPRQRPTRCPRLCGRRLPDERPPSAQSADLGPPGAVRERRTGRPQAQYAEYDE